MTTQAFMTDTAATLIDTKPQGTTSKTAPLFCLSFVLPYEQKENYTNALEADIHNTPSALCFDEIEGKKTYLARVFYEEEPNEKAIKQSFLLHNLPIPPSWFLVPVMEENWVALSLDGLPPVIAGDFYIHGSHHDPCDDATKHSLLIEAAQAFGTGHHETTRGCLTLITRLYHALPSKKSWRVLDVGQGTGVLGMAWKKFNPSCLVVGTDCDPLATEQTMVNINANNIQGPFMCLTEEGLTHPIIHQHKPYDVIMANILYEPLVQLKESITRLAGNFLILSGLLVGQKNSIIEHYKALGWYLIDNLDEGDWTSLLLQLGSSS